MSSPKVSVIIPCYNVEKYIRKCLDSVLSQTLKDIEIICIDDGSTDFTYDILMEYALHNNKIKIYKQKHQGVEAARNFGLKYAQGEITYFLDADDYFLDDEALFCLSGRKLVKEE